MGKPNTRTKAYRIFKNIRNRIGRLNGEDLLRDLLELLNTEDATSVERQRYCPVWDLLLLVKWTIMYGDFSNLRQHDPVWPSQVNALLDRMYNLSEQTDEISTLQDAALFCRRLSNQQIWLQRRESIPIGLARQWILFGDLTSDHIFEDTFYRITNLSLKDFIDLSTAVLVMDLNGIGPFVTEQSFSFLANSFGTDKIDKYLASISTTLDHARNWLTTKAETLDDVEEEYFEQSPLARFPLIKHGEYNFFISRYMLLWSLSTFVYDVLRNHDANMFMREFGAMFESHLGETLRFIGTDLLTECDLREHFGKRKSQKLVDFIVIENDCNIFVEAKGVALRSAAMVTKSPELIETRTRTSIQKGIKQGFAVASSLPLGTEIRGARLGSSENYLIIVTFKDLYLGNAQYYFDNFAPDVIGEIIAPYGNSEVIPLSNILFVSVDDLEILLGEVVFGSTTISEFVARAAKTVSSFEGRPVFRQLITQSNGDIHPPPVIKRATEELFKRAADILKS